MDTSDSHAQPTHQHQNLIWLSLRPASGTLMGFRSVHPCPLSALGQKNTGMRHSQLCCLHVHAEIAVTSRASQSYSHLPSLLSSCCHSCTMHTADGLFLCMLSCRWKWSKSSCYSSALPTSWSCAPDPSCSLLLPTPAARP